MTNEFKNPFQPWIRLEQPRLGSRVVFATDEFFAAKERLIEPQDPVFIEGKFDDHGKWMDGWESRRKRTEGHDHCIIKLGIPGIVHGFDIDTSFFTGNYPPSASIDACTSDATMPGEDAEWWELLPAVDPYALDEVNIDFVHMGKSAKNPGEDEIQIVVCRKSVIDHTGNGAKR